MSRENTSGTNASIAVGDLVKYVIPEEWNEKIEQWFNMYKICARCSKIYYEINNIGTRNCRQHAGYYQYHTQTWSCCGSNIPERLYGCIKSDHTILLVEYTEKDTLKIPRSVTRALGIPEESFESNPGIISELNGISMYTEEGTCELKGVMEEYAHIPRYDIIAANSMMK